MRDYVICPVCGGALTLTSSAAVCSMGHSYDIASSGYVNLLRPGKMNNRTAGDDGGMVAARTRFLSGGYYRPVLDKITELVSENMSGGFFVDAGCGEGYYTNGIVKSAGFDAVGIDMSKSACAAASKGARRAGISENVLYIVSSITSCPLADGCADAVISLFSPCDYSEFARILKPGGRLIIGSSGKRHLYGLKQILYGDGNVRENEYLDHAGRAETSGLSLAGRGDVSFTADIDGNENIMALFSMTPYFWRTPRDGAEALMKTDRLVTECSVDFTVLEK